MQRPSVRDVAAGKWPGLLLGFGLTERQLSGKHCPCPICGGRDRFRFDDLEGRGTWLCSHCRAGDGVSLVMAVKGWDFKTAANEIEQAAGVVQAAPIAKEQDETKKIEKLRRVWSESNPLQVGDEAMRYLVRRGLSVAQLPDSVRLHPALSYFDGEKFVGKFPAMVARVVGPDDSGLTLHRTYLKNGRKAPVESAKKLMPGKAISGGAVRLSPAGPCIGIAEGIETALAASQLFGIPVWSCISASGIKSFEPPIGVQRVIIFGDRDSNNVGQIAAHDAASNLLKRCVDVDVRIPEVAGDWLDVLVARNLSRDLMTCPNGSNAGIPPISADLHTDAGGSIPQQI